MNEEKLNHLNLMEQSLQQVMAQRQSFQGQLLEIDNAITELKNTKESYKLVGNILVKKNSDELLKELHDEKAEVDKKISVLQTQETQMKDRTEKLRSELMSEE